MKPFNIAVFLLLIIVLCFQTCDYLNKQAFKNDKSHIDTVFVKSNDHWHELPVEVPVPYKVEVPGAPGATITIPAVIDSLAVVLDYYSKRFYQDSLENDSIKLRLSVTTFKNKVIDWKVFYKWIAPTMVIKETKTVERQLAFIGVDVFGNGQQFGVFPSLYFDTKRGMVGYGYDPINNFHKVGVYGKVRLWKRKKVNL